MKPSALDDVDDRAEAVEQRGRADDQLKLQIRDARATARITDLMLL